MKKVWKCDFCSQTNESYNEIKSHENKCSFNPYNKTCYTCDNRINGEYPGDGDQCKIHSLGFFLGMEDFQFKCSDWTNLKLRNKKLSNIIKTINKKD